MINGNAASASKCRRREANGSDPRNDLRAILRLRTRAAHERLDRNISRFDLIRRTGYERFLRATAAALLPLEVVLERSGVENTLPDWPRRSRRQSLLGDLAALNVRAATLPEPPLFDQAAMLGTLYVLEGSRLGARVLMQRVSTSPDRLVRQATAYLAHGAKAGFWQSFLCALNQRGDEVDADQAAAGALAVFAMFQEGVRRV